MEELDSWYQENNPQVVMSARAIFRPAITNNTIPPSHGATQLKGAYSRVHVNLTRRCLYNTLPPTVSATQLHFIPLLPLPVPCPPPPCYTVPHHYNRRSIKARSNREAAVPSDLPLALTWGLDGPGTLSYPNPDHPSSYPRLLVPHAHHDTRSSFSTHAIALKCH